MAIIIEIYTNQNSLMKKFTTIYGLLFFVLISFQNLQAQEVCLVTADYQDGEHYIVIWEKPVDLTGLDSVFIYRKTGTDTGLFKIGSKDINELSMYKDMTSNTMDSAKYAITFLTEFGAESPLSPWHQGVVLDYATGGELIWTKYKKQGQVDESYIYGYECMRDQSELGAYSSMGYFMNYQTNWIDQAASFNPLSTYYIETHLPSCYMSKANINTSRSNIKKQFSNDEAGIDEKEVSFPISISPNPTDNFLHATLNEKLIGANYTLNDASGKILFTGTVTSKTLSINLNEVQSGTYFIHIDSKGSVISKVFMKN